jgi:hydrogenase maturation protease
MTSDILVAGIGNIFFRDDGFGPAVAAELCARRSDEPGVRVIDYGIRGMHLSYDLLDDVEVLILVDALPGSDAPGTVRVLQVDPGDLPSPGPTGLDAHAMAPVAVLSGLAALGGTLPATYVLGCVPADVSEGLGLSEPVAAAVGPAADAVSRLVAVLLGHAATATADGVS